MTSNRRRRTLTDAEREQRRTADRERAKQAASALLSSDGWSRWVRARQLFSSYSLGNQLLLALAFHERGIDPEPVAGFRTWIKLGRAVRKGERGIRLFARLAPKKADEADDRTQAEREGREERRPRYTTVAVFSLSQTDPIPGREQLPVRAPCEPLTGDTHGHLLDPLRQFAGELGYTVTFREIPGSTGGWCDTKGREIVVDTGQAVNGQVRTLVHELVHALGVTYETHTRSEAEVIVDVTTMVILGGVQLDVSGETIPYIAGWGETGALEAVTEHATLIDSLARRLENVLHVESGEPADEEDVETEREPVAPAA
jgi:N-terminal domain of anti-restriction factor ArdC